METANTKGQWKFRQRGNELEGAQLMFKLLDYVVWSSALLPISVSLYSMYLSFTGDAMLGFGLAWIAFIGVFMWIAIAGTYFHWRLEHDDV